MSIISILDHACRQILILSSSDPLLGMLMSRLLLHNNLIASDPLLVLCSALHSALHPAQLQ